MASSPSSPSLNEPASYEMMQMWFRPLSENYHDHLYSSGNVGGSGNWIRLIGLFGEQPEARCAERHSELRRGASGRTQGHWEQLAAGDYAVGEDG